LGDITDVQYMAGKRETEAMLAALPDTDQLVIFDQQRHVIETMAENIEQATLSQRQALVARLATRIVARGRTVNPSDIEWAGPVRLFFLMLGAPPDGPEPPPPYTAFGIGWYAVG
jgi:hypothetical protein